MKKRYGLSWSNTRISLLEYCEKKYFFNYYTFALKKTDFDLRNEAMILKYLKSMEMWMGEKTHILLSNYLHLLNTQGSVDEEEIMQLKSDISKLMQEEFQHSKLKDYSVFDYNNRSGLSEHFYQESVDEKLWVIIQRTIDNLDAFLVSDWYKKVKEMMDGTNIIYIEDPKTPDFESMRVDTENISGLEGLSIMASPDFWVVFWQGRYFILDWKSGKEPNDLFGVSDQLKVYALKLLLNLHKKTSLEGFDITAYEVYLPEKTSYWGEVSQWDIDDIIHKIKQDVQFQKTFLLDQDPLKNLPLPHTHFSRTSNLKKCESCSFRSVCEKLKAFE